MNFHSYLIVVVLCGAIGSVGAWVSHSFATSSSRAVTAQAEANRQAAVPGLYFLATVTVSKIPESYGSGFDPNIYALLDPTGGAYGYVGSDFAPLGMMVKVFEIQPGGRYYYYRLGMDYEPRPYPACVETFPDPNASPSSPPEVSVR